MLRKNSLLKIKRLSQHLDKYYEIKDPSIVKLDNGQFIMFASIGNSLTQTWIVGRFITNDLMGEWEEIEPVIFHNLTGPQLCAPAVMFNKVDGQGLWTMYIQTACFEEGGIIALATSTDGINFFGQNTPLVTRESVINPRTPVIGVYDAGISEIKQNGEDLLCLLYTGYRRVGCGDLYLSTKKKNEENWSSGRCVISQEDIPFHNQPDDIFFEWGLEGAKLIQLADDCFLMIGVCFLPLPNGLAGTRQRVFFAVADNIVGPFKPIGTPFAPQKNEWGTGENGHPDSIIIDDQLIIVYQERAGEGKPWHLRSAFLPLNWIRDFLRQRLHENAGNISAEQVQLSEPPYMLNQTKNSTFAHIV